MKLSWNFPCALHGFEVVPPIRKKPSRKSGQYQSVSEACIINALDCRAVDSAHSHPRMGGVCSLSWVSWWKLLGWTQAAARHGMAPTGWRTEMALSGCRMFSQSSPSHLIEHLQSISSELNFFNPGGHLKTVVSTDMNLAPNFVFLSALCFLTGNN